MDNIPIVIGVTGHRDLRNQDISELKEIVRNELKNLMDRYPNSSFSMFSSLAVGADQLCAKIAIELGIDLFCILPRDLDDFKRDFEGDTLIEFEKYLTYAKDCFVAPNTESIADLNSLRDSISDEEFYRKLRHFGYRQASIYISKHCHVLLALNEGKPPRDDGCGTAEAIDFFLNQNYVDARNSYFKTSSKGSVIEIRTPRVKNPNVEDPFKVSILPSKDNLGDILKRTDDFNKDVKDNFLKKSKKSTKGVIKGFLKKSNVNKEIIESLNPGSSGLFDEEVINNSSEKTKKIAMLKFLSGNLAKSYKKSYINLLKVYSIVAFLFVFSFMFYDQLKSNLAMIVYVVVFLIAIFYLFHINKKEFHRKSLEYRLFAECLRVQFYLTILNIEYDVYESFTWIQKNDVPWVHLAIRSILIGSEKNQNIAIEDVKVAWIDEQLEYHQNACEITKKQRNRDSKVTKILLYSSVCLGIIILFLEFINPDFLNLSVYIMPIESFILLQKNQEVILRDLFKILFVLLSAVTVLLSNYYGKLSLSRRINDHENMVELYSAAQKKFEVNNVNIDEFFIELAMEEIIENGNWLSYSKDNIIDVNI